mmetsp:Transcript_11650/g.30345  ORF Transcript_11650/g.30345 Transcript_11650/m.30345 type:complete len:410 (-) Transcript_11650:558-1787(-)
MTDLGQLDQKIHAALRAARAAAASKCQFTCCHTERNVLASGLARSPAARARCSFTIQAALPTRKFDRPSVVCNRSNVRLAIEWLAGVAAACKAHARVRGHIVAAGRAALAVVLECGGHRDACGDECAHADHDANHRRRVRASAGRRVVAQPDEACACPHKRDRIVQLHRLGWLGGRSLRLLGDGAAHDFECRILHGVHLRRRELGRRALLLARQLLAVRALDRGCDQLSLVLNIRARALHVVSHPLDGVLRRATRTRVLNGALQPGLHVLSRPVHLRARRVDAPVLFGVSISPSSVGVSTGGVSIVGIGTRWRVRLGMRLGVTHALRHLRDGLFAHTMLSALGRGNCERLLDLPSDLALSAVPHAVASSGRIVAAGGGHLVQVLGVRSARVARDVDAAVSSGAVRGEAA